MRNVDECRDMCLTYINIETYAGHVHILYLARQSAETHTEPGTNFAEQPDRTKGVLPAQQAKATCGAADMAKSGSVDTRISTFFDLDDDF